MKRKQPVLALKPTQFSVGILEVESKFEALLEMKKAARQKFAFSKPVPVVISPWSTLYVLDHHHHIYSCWLAGVSFVHIQIAHDFSKKKWDFVKFWKEMNEMSCAHLFDQFGEGPRNPLYLPADIRGMADDPYRSLAWLVRKEGGYKQTATTFAEFSWANFFRDHRLLHETGRRGMQSILNEALMLAQSPKAKSLPGYHRDAKLIAQTEKRIATGKQAKTKFVFGQHAKSIGGTQPLR
jgi:hypothetical protein